MRAFGADFSSLCLLLKRELLVVYTSHESVLGFLTRYEVILLNNSMEKLETSKHSNFVK